MTAAADPARRMATARRDYWCLVCDDQVSKGDTVASVQLWTSTANGSAPQWRWVHLICALEVT